MISFMGISLLNPKIVQNTNSLDASFIHYKFMKRSIFEVFCENFILSSRKNVDNEKRISEIFDEDSIKRKDQVLKYFKMKRSL